MDLQSFLSAVLSATIGAFVGISIAIFFRRATMIVEDATSEPVRSFERNLYCGKTFRISAISPFHFPNDAQVVKALTEALKEFENPKENACSQNASEK